MLSPKSMPKSIKGGGSLVRIGISNIAWEVGEDSAIAAILNQLGIDAIDIAPGKYFTKPSEATGEQISAIKRWWEERGIQITGMQALLFNTEGLNIFGSEHTQARVLTHLCDIFRIAAVLGATRLVFGSPKNRDRSGLTDEQSLECATAFFTKAGALASEHGVMLCLEPNPPCYGANFMTTTCETARVVRSVNHPAIRLQLDTGAVTINGESIEKLLQEHAQLVGHIHLSEPNLATLGDGGAKHSELAQSISAHLPDFLLTVEMLPAKEGSNEEAIERALRLARREYQTVNGLPM